MGDIAHLLSKVEPDDLTKQIDSSFAEAKHSAALQNKALAEAIRGAVAMVQDNQQAMQAAFAKLENRLTTEVSKLSGQIESTDTRLNSGINKLPTSFPAPEKPEKVDLSGITRMVMDLGRDIRNIPQVSLAGIEKQLKELAKPPEKQAKREYVFEIDRDMNDLVTEIKAKEL